MLGDGIATKRAEKEMGRIEMKGKGKEVLRIDMNGNAKERKRRATN